MFENTKLFSAMFLLTILLSCHKSDKYLFRTRKPPIYNPTFTNNDKPRKHDLLSLFKKSTHSAMINSNGIDLAVLPGAHFIDVSKKSGWSHPPKKVQSTEQVTNSIEAGSTDNNEFTIEQNRQSTTMPEPIQEKPSTPTNNTDSITVGSDDYYNEISVPNKKVIKKASIISQRRSEVLMQDLAVPDMQTTPLPVRRKKNILRHITKKSFVTIRSTGNKTNDLETIHHLIVKSTLRKNNSSTLKNR